MRSGKNSRHMLTASCQHQPGSGGALKKHVKKRGVSQFEFSAADFRKVRADPVLVHRRLSPRKDRLSSTRSLTQRPKHGTILWIRLPCFRVGIADHIAGRFRPLGSADKPRPWRNSVTSTVRIAECSSLPIFTSQSCFTFRGGNFALRNAAPNAFGGTPIS